MLAAIVRASNRYAMRPALVIDDRTYTYQELFGLAGSICETLRNLKEDIIGITAENRMETYASILAERTAIYFPLTSVPDGCVSPHTGKPRIPAW